MSSTDNKPELNKHPSVLEPFSLLLITAVSVIGAVVGMQLIVTLGISANTSIIGALLAILISRVPMALFSRFRSVHRQNLVQTGISSATFGAANSLMIPLGVPFAMGRPDLIIPMLIGAILAMFVDGLVLYRMFNSKAFPASGTWPAGIATAESIKAGDQGGKKAYMLVIGIIGGVVGSIFKIPMSAFGVAFIGNPWALCMFGIGLLISGYAPQYGQNIKEFYLPHGFLIGAGIVALFQITKVVFKKHVAHTNANGEVEASFEVSEKHTARFLSFSFIAFLVTALLTATLAGLYTHMSVPMLIGFIFFAAFAAFIHELIVGIAAMHSGWFPAFAVALITLVVGVLIGFPPDALGILAGLSAATGPAFADLGYDFKTGYILRGEGKYPKFERDGRRQQLYAAGIGFGVAAVAVALSYQHFFDNNLVAPAATAYAATIAAGVSQNVTVPLWLGHFLDSLTLHHSVASLLILWAIPGAILQFIGGTKRQLGVLMATGLLLSFPSAGWAVLAGLCMRFVIERIWGKAGESACSIMAAGFIAGDALYGFFSNVFFPKAK